MQGQNGSQRQRPSASSQTGSATHTPQQWFRPTFNRSVPNLVRPQHSHRALGFSSIRDFARTSRRPLATLQPNESPPPNRTLRASNSLYGTLRDQCSPPPPLAAPTPVPEASAPYDLNIRRLSSSLDSFTPDQSGALIIANHPATLPLADHRASNGFGPSPTGQPMSMGNKVSSMVKKPLSLKAKHSIARLDSEREQSSESSNMQLSENQPPQSQQSENQPPARSSPHGSVLQVQVPRRQSSLTALNLDESHFDTLDRKQPNLHHRASAPTEPLPSTVSAIDFAHKHAQTLSPPLLSPTSGLSSNSAQSLSAVTNSARPRDSVARNSVIGSRIHLPKTFPDGPIPILAPSLTINHYQCFARHEKLLISPNKSHPVPCMTCGSNGNEMWSCTFCYLRICPRCFSEFNARKKNLGSLTGWLAKGKTRERTEDVVPQPKDAEDRHEEKIEDVEKTMEELALKKVETGRKRETR